MHLQSSSTPGHVHLPSRYKAYSLWDYNVDEALWSYKKKDKFSKFKRQELGEYARLVETVKEFRDFYGLQRHSLKNIDKFLWRVGANLL